MGRERRGCGSKKKVDEKQPKQKQQLQQSSVTPSAAASSPGLGRPSVKRLFKKGVTEKKGKHFRNKRLRRQHTTTSKAVREMEDHPEDLMDMEDHPDDDMEDEGHPLDLDDEEEARAILRRHMGSTSLGGGDSGSGSQRFESSALQGLLKKLGAGLEDLLPTAGGSGGGSGASGSHAAASLFGGHAALFGSTSSLSQRLKPILLGLKRYDDEQRQLAALTELCDVLTVSSEESLVACFSCEAFMPPVVELLRCEHNPDVALFAGRVLTTLADLMPPRTAVASMLRLGAADAFCAKLMCVEYIDVAEQSLQAMEKITSAGKDHAAVCMRAGGVQAVLSFLDFFQTGVQRVAVKTAANMLACVSCKQDVTMIKDALPILVNLLSYGDDKIVEHAFLGLARALNGMFKCMSSLSHSLEDDYVSIILSAKIVDEMSKLLQVSESGSMNSSLSSSSYYEGVRSFWKVCGKSALIAEKLLDLGVPTTCTRLLQSFSMASTSSTATTPGTPGTTPGTTAATSPMVSPSMRSSENTLSILKLVDAMLPAIPESASNLHFDGKQLSFSPESHPIIDTGEEGEGTHSTFGAILERKPTIVEDKASKVLLPTLFAMVSSTLAYQLKHISLSCIKKLLAFTSSEGLKDMLRDLPASSTLMGLLSSKDCSVQLDAIFMSEVLLDKLPSIFVRYFMKEGVVFSINHIVEHTTESSPSSDPDREGVKSGTNKRERRRRSSKSSPTEGFVTPKDKLKTKVLERARAFQTKYMKIGGEHGVNFHQAPAEMEALQTLARGIEAGEAGALSSLLEKILSESAGGISSFELVHAGLEKALLAYFSASNADLCYKQTLDFARVCSRTSNSEEVFKVLLTRLHEIVSSRENLPVLACPARPPSSSTMRYLFFERQTTTSSKEASGLAALAHPFKLRFTRTADEKELRDYSSNVVLVEPLSTFEVIEDFLRTRVQPYKRDVRLVKVPPANKASSSSSAAAAENKEARASTSGVMTRSQRQKQQQEEDVSKSSKQATTSRRITRSAAKRENEDVEMKDGDEDDHDMEEDQNIGSDMSDFEEESDHIEEDHDILDEMEEDDEDDEEFDNPFRFRRESEVHEVDVSDSDSKDQKEESRGMNYAEKAAKKEFTLQFFLNGKLMDSQASVFQAVLNENNAFVNADDPQDSRGGPSVWEKVHTFTYKKHTETIDGRSEDKASRKMQRDSEIVAVKDLVKGKLSHELVTEIDQDIVSVLNLINNLVWLKEEYSRAYHADNDFVFLNGIPQEALISYRLGSKIMRQLQDLLIICGKCLPAWVHSIVQNYSSVLPFDLRRQYFHMTSLGVAHAIQYLLQQIPNGDSLRQELRDVRLVRNRRQKVRIDREKLLESACKVMSLYAKSQASLEIEYFDEVGTGLGPTLEFYTLLSAELQKRDLNIWLSQKATALTTKESVDMSMSVAPQNMDSENDGLIFGEMDDSIPTEDHLGEEETPPTPAPSTKKLGEIDYNAYVKALGDGLFPVPQKPPRGKSTSSKPGNLAYFRLLGSTFAKALYDGRLLDISLSTAFWRRALGEDLCIYDLKSVDADMSKSLIKLYEVAHSEDPAHMDGIAIEDLGLYFTLPGHDEYELCKNGSETPVTGDNLRDFVDGVLDAYFGSGTELQFSKFKEGFEEVIPLKTLAIFKPEEIDMLICGLGTETWTVEMLSECLKFDHGYTASSPYIQMFLQIMVSFTPEEQRQFLLFVTGSSRLPPGGIKGLNPALTIVRKNFSRRGDGSNLNTPKSESMHTPMNELVLENYDLPSVMTCANYIKLPPYTSQAVMKEKLFYAMLEGQSSFNLS